jgi:hypothetical protein
MTQARPGFQRDMGVAPYLPEPLGNHAKPLDRASTV